MTDSIFSAQAGIVHNSDNPFLIACHWVTIFSTFRGYFVVNDFGTDALLQIVPGSLIILRTFNVFAQHELIHVIIAWFSFLWTLKDEVSHAHTARLWISLRFKRTSLVKLNLHILMTTLYQTRFLISFHSWLRTPTYSETNDSKLVKKIYFFHNG